ncbi:FAD binding domain-containing protein [Chloroflexota bacterium]
MRFDYLQPRTIEEALALLDKYRSDAKIIAGGTDLMIKMRAKLLDPKYVIDISGIAGLNCIETDGNKGLRIGSLTTIRDLETSEIINQQFPVLAQAAGQLGSVAIRNVATVGGNLCNALPSAETAQALLALAATVRIMGPDKGERTVDLEDFFTGAGTCALQPNEILTEIAVPMPLHDTKSIYYKHSPRGSIDLAIVNIAVVLTNDPETRVCRDIKIVLGAVSSTPLRAKKAENILNGNIIDDSMIARAADMASAEASPRAGSIRGSAGYKKKIVRALTRRAIKTLLSTG